MSNQPFVLDEIDFGSFKDEQEPSTAEPLIKEETLRDDDVLLFSQEEMEQFTSDPNNFGPVENLVRKSLENDPDFNAATFSEAPDPQLFPEGKLPVDLNAVCKVEGTNQDGTLSHFVKYKLQDGKHTKVWECGVCSKEFGHQYTLMRHLPTHTDERKFQCNTCGKAFRQMSTLSQHRAIHSAERPYVCEICHKTFNRVSTLISHRKTHTGHKPHRCHLCNKAFHQKGNLRNHIFTHTNERPYKCDVCSKGFNQMSNLMCHKLKAHQRADKPRYVCQICGKDFQKRMGLRNHEQYHHGMQNVESAAAASSAPPRIKYTNGVLVDPINTAAMRHALETNQTPFALLRPLNGIPVLVRILGAGDKQMLVPATAEDLKKHGQITITQADTKNEDEKDPLLPEAAAASQPPPDGAKQVGSTVQIKIPVVATVVQRCGKDGNVLMAIQSPGPTSECSNDGFVYTTTASASDMQDDKPLMNLDDEISSATAAEIQYIDESGNLVTEDEYKAKHQNFVFNEDFPFAPEESVFNPNIQLENNVISIDDTQSMIAPSMLKDLDPVSILNLPPNANPIFEILDKPQTISLAEADTIMDATNILYQAPIGSEFVLS